VTVGDYKVQHLCLGLTQTDFAELSYRSASAAKRDLSKLLGTYRLELAIPELDSNYPRTVSISSWAETPLTPRLQAVVQAPSFQRLARISQLGFLSFVYPNAVHNRFQHAFGTYSNVCAYARALYDDPHSPFFRIVMDERDIEALLLAGLLHDLGQFPLAHDLEDAKLPGEPTWPFNHEQFTVDLLTEEPTLFQSLPIGTVLGAHWARLGNDQADDGPTPQEAGKKVAQRVENILTADPSSPQGGAIKDRLLRTILNGPIDADKLDYLLRDSTFLFAPYGRGIDSDRLLRCLTVVWRQKSDGVVISLGVQEKGKVTAEGVAFARYQMFSQAYWHHAVRIAKTMLHHGVWEMILGWEENQKKHMKGFLGELARFLSSPIDPIVGEKPAKSAGQNGVSGSLQQLHESEDLQQLHENDDLMIRFLMSRTSGRGAALLERLLKRKLFKRLATIPLEQQIGGQIIRKVIRRWLKNLDVAHRISFARRFERTLIRLAREAGETAPETAAATPEEFQKLDSAYNDEYIVIVDIPMERESDTAFAFVSERDRRLLLDEEAEPEFTDAGGVRRTGDSTQEIEPHASGLWKDLQAQFTESLGAVRVLAHPDFVDLFKSRLTRRSIENALLEELDK